jgi:type IV pilus assembly protein PilM
MAFPFPGLQPKKRNQIVAIDLGLRTTKAVAVQRAGDGFELLDYAIGDSLPLDRNRAKGELAEHFKKVAQQLEAKPKQVVIGVGVGDCLLRHAELPSMPVDEMRQMLKYGAKNYLQEDLPDHVFDCVLLSAQKSGEAQKSGQKVRALIGAARRQLVGDLQAAGKGAGLAVEMIMPGVVGPPNAFELAFPQEFAKEVVGLVDIGFRNTTISVLLNGELSLTRVVAIGAERLTQLLAESLGVAYAEAEGMKLGMTEEVQMGLMPHLSPLGRELRASIDFFEHQQDKTVSQVFVCGGSARSEFIVKNLRDELMLETRGWNPVSFMKMSLPPARMAEIEGTAPQLAVATGLALAAL